VIDPAAVTFNQVVKKYCLSFLQYNEHEVSVTSGHADLLGLMKKNPIH
jgi:hypothetical protein